MTGIRLITSGAYVGQELAAEFGELPPSFLPIGVNRLYEAQVARLGDALPIFMTIPEGFEPQPYDRHRLDALGVTLVPVPPGLKLGDSVVYALNVIELAVGAVHILHGDTLMDAFPPDTIDQVVIHDGGDDYAWAGVVLSGDTVSGIETIAFSDEVSRRRPIACGYFVLENSNVLVRALTRARGDFVEGLNLYTRERPLRAVLSQGWHDFGHIQTYFRSRRQITTARSFNTLRIDRLSVRKSSDDTAKMQAEAHWFANLPPALLPFSARLLEVGETGGMAFYSTEYQYAPTLSELFVFSSIGRMTWDNILASCHDFLSACAASTGSGSADQVLSDLAVQKTSARLDRYATETGFDLDRPTWLDDRPLPSLRQIADEIGGMIDIASGRPQTVMHGDFCLSNILYNSRAARISVIDPRGYTEAGQLSLHGDLRYDLAKLSHSIHGHYDHILAGRYRLDRPDSHRFSIAFETSAHHAWLQDALSAFSVDGVAAGGRDVRAVTVGLFLSMLPLHADRPDRQAAFIANALRLYRDLQEARR